MKRQQLNKPPRWRKLSRDEYHRAEAYLRDRERFCVSASARFLRLGESGGHLWHLSDPEGEISALLLHSRQSLFPVFGKHPRIPGPRFLNRFLGKVPIHALQGLREDVEILETLMENQGYYAAERIDYELMNLDNPPGAESLKPGPAGLTLRTPLPEDEEYLFALQSAYEQEEVLPAHAVFDPAVSRLNLQNILSREQVLVAELNGRVVGKINTSAESFTRYQIGGVYVRPDCRGLGIGAKMTSVFSRGLLLRGKGLTLFVKKRNTAARRVYRKAGFTVLADYRITYF
jgi:ribosomal protein S18 acetylase RimI-like enzyme